MFNKLQRQDHKKEAINSVYKVTEFAVIDMNPVCSGFISWSSYFISQIID